MNLKKHLSLFFIGLLLCCYCNHIYAQAPSWAWAVNAGGPCSDQANSVSTDASGNVYIAGDFCDSIIRFGTITLTKTSPKNTILGSYDNMFLVKYDAAGNVLWAKQSTGGAEAFATSVCADASGNVYVAGNYGFPSSSIIIGGITLTMHGIEASYLAKYDSSGNVLWAKKIGGPSNEDVIAYSINADSFGGVYVAGWFWGTISVGSVTLNSDRIDTLNPDIFILKYDSSGNVLWGNSAGGTGVGHANSVCSDVFGNVYVTGSFDSPSIGFGSSQLTNTGSLDIFLAKYDSSGHALWAKSGVGTGNDQAFSVITDTRGNAYIAGVFNSPTLGFDSITLTHDAGLKDNLFLAKYDSSGQALWAKKAGGTGFNETYSIATNVSGNVYMVGDFQSPVIYFDSLSLAYVANGNLANLFLAKYDSSGKALWVTSATGGDGVELCSVSADVFDNIYVTGQCFTDTTVFGSSILTKNFVNDDIFLAKLCGSLPPLSAISGSTTLCSSDSALYLYSIKPVNGASSYTWTLPGGWGGVSTNNSIMSTAGLSGTITVRANNNCVSSPAQTLTVSVVNSPLVSLTANPTVICTGDSVLLSASGGGAYVWSTKDTVSTLMVHPAVSSTYSVMVSNGVCSKDTSITVTVVNPPDPQVTAHPPDVCPGDSALLTSSGGTSYLWNTGDTANTISVHPMISSNYDVKVSNGVCSKDTGITVTVVNPPDPIVTANPPVICPGDSTLLTSSGGISYLWNTGDTANIISVHPVVSSSYDVKVSNGVCSKDTGIRVLVFPKPLAQVGQDSVIIYANSSVLLTAGGGRSYVWSPAQGLSCTACASPQASPLQTTLYYVTVTDSDGCTASDSVKVIVEGDTVKYGEVFVPGAFAPDENNENSELRVYCNCIQEMLFVVYDRLGAKVFETNDINQGWDGTYHSKALNTAVFVYYLDATLLNGTHITKKGTVSLIR